MDASSRRVVIVVAAILALSFGVRLVAAFWWQSRLPAGEKFAFGDSHSYWVLAESLARGRPYQYGPGGGLIFRTPGYPLLLAPLFWIRADPPVIWARVEGALFGTLAVAATMGLAHGLFSLRAGYLAGLVGAVYPGAVGSSIFVLSEAPYCPLLVSQVACWVAASRALTWQTLTIWSILAGMAGGAATLVRPSHLLFTPFALACAILARDRRRHLVIGAFMCAALAVVLAPWWVRNYHLTGRFVATTLQLGASLYDGLNPRTTGASDMRFVDEFVAAQQRADAASVTPLAGRFEERLDERLRLAAIDWVATHPRDACRLAVRKFNRLWSPIPNAAEFQSWVLRLVTCLSYAPLMACAVWGAWRYMPRGWPYVLCGLPAVYLTLLHVVFVSSLRYREPAMLPLMVLAAGVCQRERMADGEGVLPQN